MIITWLIHYTDDYGRKTGIYGAIRAEDTLTEREVIQEFLFRNKPGVWEKKEDIMETGFYAATRPTEEQVEAEITAAREELNFWEGLK